MASGTRDRILSSAALLFQERGYHATGVASILAAAEVNSGSLYHFFDTKETLLEGVVEHHLRRLGPMILDPAEATHHDPVKRIFIVLEHYRRTLLGSHFARGCAVGRIALEIGEDESGVLALVERYFSVWTARVEGWLESAGARIPAGTDRLALARLVLAATQGGIALARAATSIEPFDAIVAQLRNHFETITHRPRKALTEAPPISTERKSAVSKERRPPDSPAWRSW